MATLLPPPKRAKVYHNHDSAPVLQDTSSQPAPNVVVQFVSEADGNPIASAVNIPSDFTREGLEALVNKLSGQEEDPLPFSFHVAIPVPKEGAVVDPNAPTRLAISNSLLKDILEHPKQHFTSEDVLTVICSPQSVFRVRPATRCSSTLSGTHFAHHTSSNPQMYIIAR